MRRFYRLALIAVLVTGWVVGCGDTTPKPGDTTPSTTGTTSQTDAPKASVNHPGRVPAQPTDWASFLHDVAHSATASDKTIQPPLKRAWAFQTGGEIVANPIVVGDTVYIGSKDRRLYALNATRWGEKWRFTAEGEILHSVAYADGVIVLSDVKANLYGLNAQTGDLLWKKQLSGWTSSPPVYADGFVWLGVHPNVIVGYDPGSGARGSSSPKQKTIGGTHYATDRGIMQPVSPSTAPVPNAATMPYTNAAPVRANGFTYVGFQDGSLRAFDGNGATVWEATLGGKIEGAPAVAYGWLYVPSTDGNLYAFTSPDNITPITQRSGERLTIVKRDARTRSKPDAESPPLSSLNSGLELPLIDTRGGWANAQLPNGDAVWIAPGDWAVFSNAKNDAPFRENRRLASVERAIKLPLGAEYPLWSPNGKRATFFLRAQVGTRYWGAQAMWAYDAATNEGKQLLSGGFFNPNLSWSLDSQWVAFETYRGDEPVLAMVNPETSQMRIITDGLAPSFSTTSHQVAYLQTVSGDQQIWRVNSNGTEPLKITQVPMYGYAGQFKPNLPAAWHPKGVYLALGAGSQYYPDNKARLVVSGITADAAKTLIQTPAEEVRSLSWSPDGRKIVAVLQGFLGGSVTDPYDQRVTVYWFDQSAPPFSLPHKAPTWVSDRYLAYVEMSDVSGGGSQVWLVDVEARTRQLLLEADVNVTALQWIEGQKRLCVWHTSEYLRNGEFKPAATTGWLVKLALPNPS